MKMPIEDLYDPISAKHAVLIGTEGDAPISPDDFGALVSAVTAMASKLTVFAMCVTGEDDSDGQHSINNVGPKKLLQAGGHVAFLLLEQTLGESPDKWVKQSTLFVGWHVFSG